MKIGLISDTHSHLDPRVAGYFQACDEIWHAGDIGDLSVLEGLESICPVRAVYGNIDDVTITSRFPEDLFFDCEGLNVWITHIGGAPPRYNPRVRKMLEVGRPDIFICGHSHILRIARDPGQNGMLYINPGAAGNQGFHQKKTMIRFEVEGGEVKNMEVIDLGRRGAIDPV